MAKIENGVLLRVEESDIVNGTYEILEEVTIIGPCAFYGNKKLLEIVIPKNVIGIGKYAFLGCDNLIKVKATNNLLIIGEKAFYKCDSLRVFDVDQDVIETEEQFYLTRSEFINFFGNYGGENAEKVEKWQSYYSKNENEAPDGDWFTYKHLEEIYPFYPGIYKSAFENTDLNKLVVPNKMTIIGECALFGIRISPNIDFDLSNIIRTTEDWLSITGFGGIEYENYLYKTIDENNIRIKAQLQK